MHGRVEAPGVVGEAEVAHDLELEDLLRGEVEVVRRRRAPGRSAATSLTSGAWCSFR